MKRIKKSLLACSTIFCATLQAGGAADEIFSSNFQYDTVLAASSFEEPVSQAGVNDGKYFDTGSAYTAHDLVNNAGQAPVDITGTAELDFDASWAPYNSITNDSFVDPFGNDIEGMTEGDWAGVTTFAPTNSTYTDGLQGYQMSDADGTMTLVSEPVDLLERVHNSMTIDYFISSTTWEIDEPAAGNDIRNDGIRIYAENMVTNDRYYILDTLTDNILTILDIDDLGIEGAWQNGSIDLPDDVIVRLVVEFRAGSSNEILFLDNVKFKGSD